ncbi:hypothetical protein [uncultured Roseovarius sp.]|uniref:hypothetical protein n=1 Tax=uncultured Roseovarius sp. TaxID=293344 RepID=UPI0026214D60|nr:hypothetical protein [uncultured Roseovarius sp.]
MKYPDAILSVLSGKRVWFGCFMSFSETAGSGINCFNPAPWRLGLGFYHLTVGSSAKNRGAVFWRAFTDCCVLDRVSEVIKIVGASWACTAFYSGEFYG